MRKFIEGALKSEGKEQGNTLEEIERNIRSFHHDDFDPKTDLSVQLKLALKRGVSKGRYLKQGRFYKMSPRIIRSPKVCTVKFQINWPKHKKNSLRAHTQLSATLQSVIIQIL